MLCSNKASSQTPSRFKWSTTQAYNTQLFSCIVIPTFFPSFYSHSLLRPSNFLKTQKHLKSRIYWPPCVLLGPLTVSLDLGLCVEIIVLFIRLHTCNLAGAQMDPRLGISITYPTSYLGHVLHARKRYKNVAFAVAETLAFACHFPWV